MVYTAMILQFSSKNCLTVFIIVYMVVLSSSELRCPRTNTRDGYKLRCPTFTVQVKPQALVSVQCNNTDTSDFSPPNGMRLGDVDTFIIKLCPLYSVSVSQFMETMGVTNVNNVQFTYTRVNSDLAMTETHELFRGLSSITSLTLHNAISSNKTTNLPTNVFVDMINMKEINLCENELFILPRNLFRNNTKLETVNIQNNWGTLKSLPDGLLANLSKLKEVTVQGCKMSSLPKDLLWGSMSIRTISLKNNTYTELPESLFRDCVYLRILDISYNQITNLPLGLFDNTQNLEILKVNNNQLTTIESNLFSSLRALRILDMKDNRLTEIKTGAFAKLHHLKAVNMSNNELKFLETHRSKIGHEVLSALSFCDLLEDIQLANNSLTGIFSDWRNLKHLSILNLTYNKISYIEARDLCFVSAKDIIVDVSYNDIYKIDMFDAKSVCNAPAAKNYHRVPVRHFYTAGNCDCKVHSLLQYVGGEITVKVELKIETELVNLQCSESQEYVDMLKENIPIKFVTCLLKNEDRLNCPDKCDCLLRPSDNALIVNCHQKDLDSIPEALPDIEFSNYTELNLSGNHIQSIKIPLGPGYNKVTKCILSHNEIREIDLSAFSSNIQVLEIDSNNINQFDMLSIYFLMNAEYLTRLTLHNNPWRCDCSTIDFVTKVENNYNLKKVKPLDNVMCENGKLLLKVPKTEMCPPAKSENGDFITFVFAVIGLIFGMLAALYFKFEREIKVWLILRESR